VVLCFSPVGDKFRIRARQFPALVNCTAFDWFHGWPHEALVSVAQRFLVEIPDLEEETRSSIAKHMAFVHTEVTSASVSYFQAARRYCYTTPKSYLELISLYKELLARKRSNLSTAKERLVSGVEKIAQVSNKSPTHQDAQEPS
jgi:dynein heavy chain, axonemal